MASSGSGGGAAAAAAGAGGGVAELPPPAICCMCGDQGLLQEMFQCKVCTVRSQHKYCSELYLKTESYRACNWCLRESNSNPLPITRDAKSKLSSSPSTSSSSNAASAAAVKIHRDAFPSQLNNKPVKKLRVLQTSSSQLDPTSSAEAGDRLRSEQELLKAGPRQQQQVGKPKVRRYKLLEEVSS